MARVIFNEDRCKGCKLCTAVCPKKIVIILEDKLNQKVSIQLVSMKWTSVSDVLFVQLYARIV